MNDQNIRQMDMFVNVKAFGLALRNDFALDGLAMELFAVIDGVLEELAEQNKNSSSSGGATKKSTTAKNALKDELKKQMKLVNSIAVGIAKRKPGFDAQFQMPKGRSDQDLLAGARAFIRDIEPVMAEFLRREIKSDFIETMKKNIVAFEEMVANRAQQKGNRVEATSSIATIIKRGLGAVDELKPIILAKYEDFPDIIVRWDSASHVKQAPGSAARKVTRKNTKKKPSTPQQPPVQ